MSVTRRIRKLEQHVVDKIAAGEVIQRPRNAVKELIENSLDAKATCIQVHVKYTNSDIQLIQVKDNGSGIEPADLDAVCERFSTSKLATFEDLSSVQTYGFRGEALASMSHVSHVTIVSRVRHSVVGYTMKYEAGQPVDKPKAAASNVGTTISVEDLFYNVPMRKNALRNLSEEYKLIVELVGLYAIDNLDVSFVLRRNCGDPDVKTSGTGDLVSAIRDICGARMAKNLVPIAYSDNSKFKAKVNGWVGDLKSNLKSYTFILFINKRLVDCPTLRKSVEAIYKSNLAKGSCAFMYFSISIAPEQVDVNVHPTKNEVRFLYDDELAQEIAATVETKILDARSQIMERQDTTPKRPTITASPGSAKHPANLVRNCPHSQKVDEMFHRQGIRQNIGQNSYRRDVRLSSVLSLRQTVLDELSPRHKQLLADSNFVGFVKDDLSAFIQFQTFLIRISFIPICENLFYQLCLEDFQNFGVIEISPLSVSELAGIHLNELEVR
ncbi:DNA mismatch repair protein Mlh1 [Halotydeus destructor]|nr:DNA mismatch repair protein Mlh1 [Halotydeus destructor]